MPGATSSTRLARSGGCRRRLRRLRANTWMAEGGARSVSSRRSSRSGLDAGPAVVVVQQRLAGVDQPRQHFRERGSGRVVAEDRLRDRPAPLLAGLGRLRLLLRLEGQVQVFEPLADLGRETGRDQVVV